MCRGANLERFSRECCSNQRVKQQSQEDFPENVAHNGKINNKKRKTTREHRSRVTARYALSEKAGRRARLLVAVRLI